MAGPSSSGGHADLFKPVPPHQRSSAEAPEVASTLAACSVQLQNLMRMLLQYGPNMSQVRSRRCAAGLCGVAMTPSIWAPLAACSVQLWHFVHMQQLQHSSLLVLQMLVCMLLLRLPIPWARHVQLQVMQSAAMPPLSLKCWLACSDTQKPFQPAEALSACSSRNVLTYSWAAGYHQKL